LLVETILERELNMNDFEIYFRKAADYHGHACAGIALGTKMTLAAMRYLGFDPSPKNKNLMVFVEVSRCMTDAVQAISCCTLGHRTLRFIDYGKFAASFVDLESGKAVRATVRESFDSSGPIEEVAAKISQMADSDLVILEDVKIDIAADDLPGHSHKKAFCQVCGERVMDGRDVTRDSQTLCRACAGVRYYIRL
jgi:formylmethanofuran dehydrogenase subunit E